MRNYSVFSGAKELQKHDRRKKFKLLGAAQSRD